MTTLDFSGSASDITFDMEGDGSVPVLRAHLNPYEGDPVEADVNLAECIGNDCGTLVFGKSWRIFKAGLVLTFNSLSLESDCAR